MKKYFFPRELIFVFTPYFHISLGAILSKNVKMGEVLGEIYKGGGGGGCHIEVLCSRGALNHLHTMLSSLLAF